MTCPICSGSIRFVGAYAARCDETGYHDEGDRYQCDGPCGGEFDGDELDEMCSAPCAGAVVGIAPVFSRDAA